MSITKVSGSVIKDGVILKSHLHENHGIDLQVITDSGNTTPNDITVNNITQSNTKLSLNPQYAGSVASITQETIGNQTDVSNYGYQFYYTYDGDAYDLLFDTSIIDLFGGDPNNLIGKEFTVSGDLGGGASYTGTGVITSYYGPSGVPGPTGFLEYFFGTIIMDPLGVDFIETNPSTTLIFGSQLIVDVIQTVNVDPIAEGVDYVMSKSATDLFTQRSVLGGASIISATGSFFTTDALIDGWDFDAEFFLELANGDQHIILPNGSVGSGPYTYYYGTSTSFDATTATGVFKNVYAEVYSVDVSGVATIIKTTIIGSFSTNDDVWLHQSKSKIQVVDNNFEPLDILSYDRITGVTTTAAKSYIDKNSTGDIVDLDTQETLIDTGKIEYPAIVLLTNTYGSNNFNSPTSAGAFGSIILSGGGLNHQGGQINGTVVMGNSMDFGQGMSYSTLIGIDLYNSQNYSAEYDVMIGRQIYLDDGYVNSSSYGPRYNVLIGREVRAARPYSVGIGNGVSVYDAGATSVNKPYTFEYNVGRVGSTLSLNSLQNLYLGKYSFYNYGNWTTNTPTVTDSNMRYLFNTRMMNNRSTVYNDSCIKIRINGVWKDKTANIPISVDKVYTYYWTGSSWAIGLENEREGDSNWDARATFIDNDNFAISIYNNSGGSRSLFGVNLNVEVTFTT